MKLDALNIASINMGNSQSHYTSRRHSHRRSSPRRRRRSHNQVHFPQPVISDLETLHDTFWEKASRQHHLRKQHDFLIRQILQVPQYQRPQQRRTSSETTIQTPRVSVTQLERICDTMDQDIARMLEWQEYDIQEAIGMLRERLREIRVMASAGEE